MTRLRAIARTLIVLRGIIIAGYIERLADRPDEELMARFDGIARTLPMTILYARDGLERRVAAPARRMIERDGILAYITPSDYPARDIARANPEGWR